MKILPISDISFLKRNIKPVKSDENQENVTKESLQKLITIPEPEEKEIGK